MGLNNTSSQMSLYLLKYNKIQQNYEKKTIHTDTQKKNLL